MNRLQSPFVAVCCFSITILVGCSSETTVPITGSVTVGGTPVGTGEIVFLRSDDRTSLFATEVQAGAYQMQVRPGDYVVRISGYEVVGQQPRDTTPGAPVADVLRPMVPARYSRDGALQVQVTGPDEYSFALPTD